MFFKATILCVAMTAIGMTAEAKADSGGGFPFWGIVKLAIDRDGNGVDDFWKMDIFNTGFILTLVDAAGNECVAFSPPVGTKVGFTAWPLISSKAFVWRALSFFLPT